MRASRQREQAVAESGVEYRVGGGRAGEIPVEELTRLIAELESQMHEAAAALEFEKAALIRDQVYDLRRQLLDAQGLENRDVPEWKRDFEVDASPLR